MSVALGAASSAQPGHPWLIDQVDKLARAAQLETNSLLDTKRRLEALWTRANRETDSARAAWMKQQLRPITAQHDRLARYWIAVRAKINAVLSGARKFLDAIGIHSDLPVQLGVVGPWLVPIVLVSAVLLAWAGLNYLHPQNEAHTRALKLAEQLLQSPSITAEQRAQLIDAITHEANAKPDAPDPLGIARTLEAALPLALVIGAIVLLPQLLESSRRRRLSRGYA